MTTTNDNLLKDMVGEVLIHKDEVTFQAGGGEQTGIVVGFNGMFVKVKSLRGDIFNLAPNDVMTDRGADRIVKNAEANRK